MGCMNLDWIAGFFDGEGSVSLRVARNSTCKSNYQFLPEITIGQKTPFIINAIHKRLRLGHVYPMGGGWQFVVHSRSEICKFISIMLTRTCLKKRHLLLLKRALSLLANQPKPSERFRGKGLSKETMLQLVGIVEEIRGLNRSRWIAWTIPLSEVRAAIISL